MNDYYFTLINESMSELLRVMQGRVSKKELRRISTAFELAKDAHKEQKRKSGEPYIIHPVAVALIVAVELELGAKAVMAAFLQDVVEDSSYTLRDIQEKFGDDVAFLVGAVTKQKNANSENSKQVDNFRQILLSFRYDIRALLIKLADRLHNMRTMDSMPPEKQVKIAGETDYFYAPLANRLGLYHVKSELENLSFRYRCPREFAEVEKMLDDEQIKDKAHVGAFVDKIKAQLEQHGIFTRLEVRYRSPYSIWRKMKTSGRDFNHTADKHYIRIIYANGAESEKNVSLKIYSILTDCFQEKPGSVINYVNAPKANGYQSFHVKLLTEQGRWEEIHISSERMVRNSRLGCTAERTERTVKQWLEKFQDVLRDIAGHTLETDFMDGVRYSCYYDDIMVFTPTGQAVILPKGAVALDLAFELHGPKGIQAAYARINGRLSAVTTPLQRGDCVDIMMGEASLPDDGWMDKVITFKAKRAIRRSLAKRPLPAYHRCEHCHPLPGDEVIGFVDDQSDITLHKRNCPDAIRLASHQGDTIRIVTFSEDEDILYPVRIKIRGVDRFHLLSDLIGCITDNLHLSITRLFVETIDRIAECTIDFAVHSVRELQAAVDKISTVEGIDEVSHIDIE